MPHATIRNRTGWEFGSEGKSRFEISDAEARIKPEPRRGTHRTELRGLASDLGSANQRMEKTIEHRGAYEAYPWLRDMRTSLDVGEGTKPGAELHAPPTKHKICVGSHGEI